MTIVTPDVAKRQAAVSDQLRASVRLPDVVDLDVLATEIKNRVDAAHFSKLYLYANAFLNRANFLGYQWSRWDAAVGLTDVENPDGELREVANRIQPNVRLLLGLLAGGASDVAPVPTTAQTRDKQFALISRSVLEYVGRINHSDRIKEESDGLRVMDGTACVRTFLDPQGGMPMTVQAPGMGAQTVQVPEIRKEVYSIFHAHIFPTRVKTPRDVQAVMFDARKPVEMLAELYPQFADAITEDNTHSLYERENMRLDMLFSPATNDKTTKSGSRGTARVYEYFELPCQKYPQGRRVTMVNDFVVEYDVNPFCGLFPPESPKTLALGCVFLRGIQVPGEFWGIGFPEAARPSQMRLNRIKTDQTMNRLAMGRNRILAARGAVSDSEQVTNIHGALIEYDQALGGQVPTIMPAVALPGVSMEIKETLKDIDDEFGLYDIMRGMNAPQVRSGEQFQGLLNSGNQKFTTLTNEREMADADDARITLALARRYYPPLKLLRIVGENKGYTLSLMQGQNIYADVDVVRGSAMPRDPGTWNSLLMNLWKEGMLLDGTGRPNIRWLSENLDLGGYRYESPVQLDVDRQQTENSFFEQGRWVPPQEWDNHPVHIDECNLYLKEHPEANPNTVRMVLYHRDLHHMMLAQSAIMPSSMVPPGPVIMQQRPQHIQPATNRGTSAGQGRPQGRPAMPMPQNAPQPGVMHP